jgi:hypothetical protein
MNKEVPRSKLFNRFKLFVGPEGSGRNDEVNRLSKGKRTMRVQLKGLRRPAVEKLLCTLTMPADTEMLVLENMSPSHLATVVMSTHLHIRPHLMALLPHVIITITTSNGRFLKGIDHVLQRRVDPFGFPRLDDDQVIGLYTELADSNTASTVVSDQ